MNSSRKPTAALGLAIFAIAGALPIQPASAVTASTTFQVSASVLSFCGVVATPLAFGNYSGAQVDGTAGLLVTCTAGTPYTVGLNAGTGTGSSITARRMVRLTGTELLNYGLFTDASRSINWGDTAPNNAVAGTGSGLPQSLTVYGRIAADQLGATTGVYLDTITVSVVY